MSWDEKSEYNSKNVPRSYVLRQPRVTAKYAVTETHYIIKRMSRSGSIPCGNLHLTLDIPFRVKCYQSLTPIHYFCLNLFRSLGKEKAFVI